MKFHYYSFTDNCQDVSAGSANRSGREYVPKVGSGGYAILLALYLESLTQGKIITKLTKNIPHFLKFWAIHFRKISSYVIRSFLWNLSRGLGFRTFRPP